MSDQVVVLCSIAVLLFLLIQNRIKPSLLFSSLILFFYLFDFISLENWLKNYVNSSLVTLVLLLLLSIAIEKTVFIRGISRMLITKNYNFSLLKLTVFTSMFSAFLNNTAVVASLIPVITQNRFHKPSKLLIPLSYAAIFGGVMTLVGTSTNLIVNGLAIESGLQGFKLFDFLYTGAVVSFFCIGALLLLSRFLPEIDASKDSIKEYLIETRLKDNSKLVGKSIKESGLRSLEYLFLVEIQRGDELISPVTPDEVLKGGDILVFSGDVRNFDILKRFDGLYTIEHTVPSGNIVEVIISPESNLIDKKVKEANFRSKFNAAIIALQRGSQNIKKIGEAHLRAGDKLILSVGKDFSKRDNIAQNFYTISKTDETKGFGVKESYFTVLSFFGVIFLSAFGLISIIKGLSALLFIYLALGFIDSGEIRRRFPYDIAMIVGASLGIARVLIDSGSASLLSGGLDIFFGEFGVYGSFVGVYLMTLILTEFITNNAAAALSFPIAYASATGLGVDPTPFILAVAYGASASFITPYGYQTNLMVASAGGYGLKDFTKVGIVVSVIYSLCVVLTVPLFFSF